MFIYRAAHERRSSESDESIEGSLPQ